ncbi:MAG: hypothetical protein ACR2I2_00845 [Bryobacteraceae bacterium]
MDTKDIAGDSDINCNGGTALGGGRQEPCSGLGLELLRVLGYDNDQSTHLTVTGGKTSEIRYEDSGTQTIDLSGRNWILLVRPHAVIIHTFDKGANVDIDTVFGRFTKVSGMARKHSHPNDIGSMTLFVEGQLPQSLPGCRFRIVYDKTPPTARRSK